jgi:hypothetical protein
MSGNFTGVDRILRETGCQQGCEQAQQKGFFHSDFIISNCETQLAPLFEVGS